MRTPLATLKGRIGVTLSQPRRPEEYVDTLQDMEHEVDRLVRLSGDLLYMARLEQGQFEPTRPWRWTISWAQWWTSCSPRRTKKAHRHCVVRAA
ncbi:MAG: histidine kinase dimerization/phospho-acceptor domain-containing protein [Caldilineaceae bacterium]